jgi:hypothetical protein
MTDRWLIVSTVLAGLPDIDYLELQNQVDNVCDTSIRSYLQGKQLQIQTTSLTKTVLRQPIYSRNPYPCTFPSWPYSLL